MNLEQIDATLAGLRGRSGQVADDLLAISRMITYQRLVGEGGWPRVALEGPSAERAGRALASFRNLWARSAALAGVLDRAEGLRGTVSRILPSQRTLDEVERLLLGPSVVPIDGGAGLAPGALLDEMAVEHRSAFEAIRAVDAAWDRHLPALAAFEAEAIAIEAEARSLGEPPPAELAEARRALAGLRRVVEHDPLSADPRSAEVETRLEAARGRLREVAEGRDRVDAGLAEGRRLLGELAEAHRRAEQARDDRSSKVRLDGPDPVAFPEPLDDARIAALASWLETLEATRRDGRWKPASVGLGRWSAVARGYIDSERACFEANDAPLRERRDLRGLLDALKAKASGLGRAEDEELGALAHDARALLHARPTPLAEARRLVAEYQSRLL